MCRDLVANEPEDGGCDDDRATACEQEVHEWAEQVPRMAALGLGVRGWGHTRHTAGRHGRCQLCPDVYSATRHHFLTFVVRALGLSEAAQSTLRLTEGTFGGRERPSRMKDAYSPRGGEFGFDG